MESDVYEVPLSIEKMKSEKAYRESKSATIVSIICALLNSDGGEFNIKFEDDLILGAAKDSILRMMEQRLVDIIGSCVFYAKVRILQRNEVTKQLVFMVDSSQSLCTVDYNLYLPTQSQVIPIAPWEPLERVRFILNREVRNENQFENYEDFVNRQVPFEESDSIQFKQLKDEKSKCVSLADRMTNKSNKLERYMSGFANKNGGRIFYGISDDGVVKGEAIGKKDQEEIIRKVTKIINQLIWPGGKLERGKHWDIQFAPVKDENQNEIPSLFVVIISVVPLRGGLFIKEPESYHVVQSRLVRMSFTEWSRRFFADEQSSAVMDMVPSVVRRVKWSSTKTQKTCHCVLQSLVKYQNDGDHDGFEKFAAFAKRRFEVAEVQLIILGERSAHAYKSGQFEKAESLIAEYEQYLSQHRMKDCLVFMLRAVYAKSAICRAKGNYKESDALAHQGLQLAEMAPAGILVAWFYNHVAIVEKFISQQTKEKAERVSLVQSALDHYIKALQHTQSSSIEQEFSITVADLYQRIHTFRAITLLCGDVATGANCRKATPSDIKAAETDVSVCDRLILQGFKETKYRKIYHLFSLSDLVLCRWWQQRQQKTKEKRSSEDYETPYLLKDAFDYATEAKELSIQFHFEQLTNYARNRLVVIIEIMIKHKVSSIRLPRNRVNKD